MKLICLSLITGGLLLQPLAFADVSYQETTQFTGGSMMGLLKMAGAFSSQTKQLTQPVTSKVSVHGSRMVRANVHTTEIIDLDQQTITSIDHDKRTYSTVTFQQMEQQMAKMATQAKGSKPTASGDPQMTFTAHITRSGATRQIDGQTASEALLTITAVSSANDANNTKGGMAATSELWVVQDVPGMQELRRFNERMAKELSMDMGSSGMASLLTAQPGGAQALAELKKEAGKMTGIEVLQVTRVGLTTDGQPLPPPSAASLPPVDNHGSTDAATPDTKGTADQSQGSSMSRLGSFGRALSSSAMGGMVHHTNSNTPAAGPGSDAATAGVLLENQTQTFGFSEAPVADGLFQIPAGYKEVTSPMAK